MQHTKINITYVITSKQAKYKKSETTMIKDFSLFINFTFITQK